MKYLGLLCGFILLAEATQFSKTLELHGIPPNAKRVLILSQSAHLDYDWQNWFPTNVNNTPPDFNGYFNPDPTQTPQWTNRIFTSATNLMKQYPTYHYSVCEMSFLQGFQEQEPALWDQLMQMVERLEIVGGGMTSPDNLLPHGETFIRNYLVAQQWLKSQNVPWSYHTWMPDDFGHDSQLPVLLQAIGAISVAFSRIPGACDQGGTSATGPNSNTAAVLLDEETGGVDFYWQANDGSTAVAHWLQAHYCQGYCLYDGSSTYNSVQDNLECKPTLSAATYEQYFQAFINTNGPVAPTPAMFVPVSCDFAMPFVDLTVAVDDWNTNKFNSTGVYAVAGNYDMYMSLVLAYEKDQAVLKSRSWHGTTPSTNFRPAPYWTGFYASRTFLKQLHDATTKVLVAAEAAASLSGLANQSTWQTQLYAEWAYLVPSTHHDFITGTAIDHVYDGSEDGVPGEQLATLQRAYASSTALLENILKGFASWPSADALYFNSLGFPINATVEVNGELATASIPALGWLIPSLQARSQWQVAPQVPVRSARKGSSFQLSNAFLTATIESDPLNGWVIGSIIDASTGQNILGGSGNVLSFWNDQGGTLYRFAFEVDGGDCTFEVCKSTVSLTDGGIVVSNDLFTTFSGNMTVTIAANPGTTVIPYQVNYTLFHNEPFLRVQVAGASPYQTSVFTQIPLGQNTATVDFGTTYHWETKTPSNFGPVGNTQQVSPAFDAVHDFIIPNGANGNPILGVYMDAIRTWGVEPQTNILYGVLMRNNWDSSPSCMGQGADGTDSAYHTLSYAIRVPSGLSSPATGQARREATTFNTPPYAVFGAGSGETSSTLSLANIVGNSAVQITVVKPGSYNPDLLVVRLYNPTNSPVEVTIQFPGLTSLSSANYLSALEELITGPEINISGNSVTFTCTFALTTFAVAP